MVTSNNMYTHNITSFRSDKRQSNIAKAKRQVARGAVGSTVGQWKSEWKSEWKSHKRKGQKENKEWKGQVMLMLFFVLTIIRCTVA